MGQGSPMFYTPKHVFPKGVMSPPKGQNLILGGGQRNRFLKTLDLIMLWDPPKLNLSDILFLSI